MLPSLVTFGEFALLAARLVYGAIFAVHGWPKIKNLKNNAQNFEMMGFKPGVFWGTIVAITEFFGGLLLIIGWFTQVAALLLAAEMTVAAIWKIKRGEKFAGGWEFDLILMAVGLVLATVGGGIYGLDNYLPTVLF